MEENPYFTLEKLLPYLIPKLKILPICHLFHLLFPIWHLCHFFAVTALSPRRKDHLAPPVFSCVLCSCYCIFFLSRLFIFRCFFSRRLNRACLKNHIGGAIWSFRFGLNAVTAKKLWKCQIGNKRWNRWQIGKVLSFGVK
jgi:hypothetical protein